MNIRDMIASALSHREMAPAPRNRWGRQRPSGSDRDGRGAANKARARENRVARWRAANRAARKARRVQRLVRRR